MKVSIVILNYNYPEIIDVCLHTLAQTEGVEYETIVVDNASEPAVVEILRRYKDEGLIDKLILEGVNHYFSGGNNIGVRNADPSSEYVLLLNSDVAFLRPDWLTKQIAWMENTAEYWPSVWGLHPTQPKDHVRDIVSMGWSFDLDVEPCHARPEGFCCLIRKTVWRDMSTDIPWKGGFEEMMANAIRNGAKCGVLSQYNNYLVHAEGGSSEQEKHIKVFNKRQPNIKEWFADLYIETLDFTLGPDEHQSYLWW